MTGDVSLHHKEYITGLVRDLEKLDERTGFSGIKLREANVLQGVKERLEKGRWVSHRDVEELEKVRERMKGFLVEAEDGERAQQ